MPESVPPGPERTAKIMHLFTEEGTTITELAHRFRCSYWTIRNELLAVPMVACYLNKGKG